jgi:hypothetical protein
MTTHVWPLEHPVLMGTVHSLAVLAFRNADGTAPARVAPHRLTSWWLTSYWREPAACPLGTVVTPPRKDGVMGRNNRQRRSEKQHKQSARLRAQQAPRPVSPSDDADLDVLGVLRFGARAAHGPTADEADLDAVVDALVGAVGSKAADVEPMLSRELVRFIAALWEGGWQPLDLVHVVRRQATGRIVRLLQDVIGEEALRSNAASRAPVEWVDQLAAAAAGESSPTVALGDTVFGDTVFDDTVFGDTVFGDTVVVHWRHAAGLALAEGLYEALRLLGMLGSLPRLSMIGPPPSLWSARHRGPRAAHRAATADPKMLGRIRALLAKAEATTFEAEADAFTSKAQDLMTRHAIDAAVLQAADHHDLRGDVVVRRVHLDNPYATEKLDLLAVVSRSNGVKTVWNDGLGFATLVGLPIDLDLTELLFTSLLVQATRAVGDAASASANTRSRSFRRAFLVSYAHRIGERLEDAVEHASTDAIAQYGTSLVPILAARTEAVEEAFEQMFPNTRPMRGRRFDAQGWEAGRAAADLAVLDAGRSRLTG